MNNARQAHQTGDLRHGCGERLAANSFVTFLTPLQRFELSLDLIDFRVRTALQINEPVAGLGRATQELIELEMKGTGIAILRVLH